MARGGGIIALPPIRRWAKQTLQEKVKGVAGAFIPCGDYSLSGQPPPSPLFPSFLTNPTDGKHSTAAISQKRIEQSPTPFPNQQSSRRILEHQNQPLFVGTAKTPTPHFPTKLLSFLSTTFRQFAHCPHHSPFILSGSAMFLHSLPISFSSQMR